MGNQRDRGVLLGTAEARLEEAVRTFAKGYELSDRESDVMILFVRGLWGKSAAEAMGCAPSTVDVFWRRIIRKTGCRSRESVAAALFLHLAASQDEGRRASADLRRVRPRNLVVI